jgi:hypothetical protein
MSQISVEISESSDLAKRLHFGEAKEGKTGNCNLDSLMK